MRFKIFITILSLTLSSLTYAQKFSVSTNLLDCIALGTLNADVSYAFSRHWSVMAGARYNPFTFNAGDPERQFQIRQQSYSAGVRLWPWHIWSGWWFASKLRYQEYNAGGLLKSETREGDRFGLGLYSGYTYMLSSHINIEFGLGFWGGCDIYKVYNCPRCGLTTDEGKKAFILPDDLMVGLVYVF